MDRTTRPRSDEAIDAQKAIGVKLREVRRSLGMTLHDVERKSDRQWIAVVVGSYERGDRAITVGRLVELCNWYGIPPVELFKAAGELEDPLIQIRRNLHKSLELLEPLMRKEDSKDADPQG